MDLHKLPYQHAPRIKRLIDESISDSPKRRRLANISLLTFYAANGLINPDRVDSAFETLSNLRRNK